MPAPTYYIAGSDLRLYLTPATFIALFDDANEGNLDDDAPQVMLAIELAHAEVTSYLLTENATLPDVLPAAVPSLLRFAELDYAMAIAFDRHPEYVRKFGEDKRSTGARDRAEKRMDEIIQAIRRIPGFSPPANVGGMTVDSGARVMTPNTDGSGGSGDF